MKGSVMRKAITPLIAAVLLIAFTMAVAGLAGPWLTEISKSAQVQTQESQDKVLKASDASFSIEEISYNDITDNYTISIINTGQRDLDNFTVTIYGNTYQKKLDKTLSKGEIYTFDIKTDDKAGDKKIEIDANNLAVSKSIEVGETPTEVSNTIIENVEDRDLSNNPEWEGNTDDASVSDSQAQEGDNAIRYATQGNPINTKNIIENIERGDRLIFHAFISTEGTTGNTDTRLRWRTSAGDFYSVRLRDIDDEFWITKDGSKKSSGSISGGYTYDNWYKIEIHLKGKNQGNDKDEIIAILKDENTGSQVSKISFSDSDYSNFDSIEIAQGASSGTPVVYHDYIYLVDNGAQNNP